MPPFLIRMLLWARRPPSRRQQIAFAVVIGIGLAFAAIELVFGWPEWLTPERVPRGPRFTAP
ncbi:hypothetical protein N8I71_03400 [Roseibacterium sp. SDUM158016]|jgi:hypothetical protein|uniref:hypothetical protein n=1 Tax=Roseicyclus sediminis TaxID=2980997 RepID=UPI0021D308C4|nr:hypothetical protein [Roseibacterium sp. SDUM158016]MCU4651859.1 hypothetical protein [Roseibacterium sp. SDUM158016]